METPAWDGDCRVASNRIDYRTKKKSHSTHETFKTLDGVNLDVNAENTRKIHNLMTIYAVTGLWLGCGTLDGVNLDVNAENTRKIHDLRCDWDVTWLWGT